MDIDQRDWMDGRPQSLSLRRALPLQRHKRCRSVKSGQGQVNGTSLLLHLTILPFSYAFHRLVTFHYLQLPSITFYVALDIAFAPTWWEIHQKTALEVVRERVVSGEAQTRTNEAKITVLLRSLKQEKVSWIQFAQLSNTLNKLCEIKLLWNCSETAPKLLWK